MTPEQKQRQRDRLRAEQPELVAALSSIPRECISAMVVTSDGGEVIARTDRPLAHDPAEVIMPDALNAAEMQKWARSPLPTLQKMPEPAAGKRKKK